LADIINYFIKYVRPSLNPKRKIISMWLNTKGKPLGMNFIYV